MSGVPSCGAPGMWILLPVPQRGFFTNVIIRQYQWCRRGHG